MKNTEELSLNSPTALPTPGTFLKDVSSLLDKNVFENEFNNMNKPDDDKKVTAREKNRIAAQKARLKKKEETILAQQTLLNLLGENQELEQKSLLLASRIDELNMKLVQYADCRVAIANQVTFI